MAVSACADRGNMVVFDSAGSCILSGNSPEIRQIRELIRAATKEEGTSTEERRYLQLPDVETSAQPREI